VILFIRYFYHVGVLFCCCVCGEVCSCRKVTGGMEKEEEGHSDRKSALSELMCVALGCGGCVVLIFVVHCIAGLLDKYIGGLCAVVGCVVVLSVYVVYSCMWRLLWPGQLVLTFYIQKVQLCF
jgi:hypothetical protein